MSSWRWSTAHTAWVSFKPKQCGQLISARKTWTDLAVILDFHSVWYREVLVHKTWISEGVWQGLPIINQYFIQSLSLIQLITITTFTANSITLCKCLFWWRSWSGMWVSRVVWSMCSMWMGCGVVLIAFKPITANGICGSSNTLTKSCHCRSNKFFDGSIAFVDLFFSESEFRIFTESLSFKSRDPTFDSICMIIGICSTGYISSTCFAMESWNSPIII